MTRTKTIIISILLMTAAIIITSLTSSDSQNKNGLISFFSGIVFGAGISIFIKTIIKKKTDSN